jgi:lipocalin
MVRADFGVFKMETDYLAASIKELEETLAEAQEHAAQKDEADEYSGEWYEMIDLLTKIEGAIVSLKEATA